jgi:hypothetical protein
MANGRFVTGPPAGHASETPFINPRNARRIAGSRFHQTATIPDLPGRKAQAKQSLPWLAISTLATEAP